MKHIKNTTTNGIYKDHTGKLITGPKLLPKSFFNSYKKLDLICGQTWSQITTRQKGY